MCFFRSVYVIIRLFEIIFFACSNHFQRYALKMTNAVQNRAKCGKTEKAHEKQTLENISLQQEAIRLNRISIQLLCISIYQVQVSYAYHFFRVITFEKAFVRVSFHYF